MTVDIPIILPDIQFPHVVRLVLVIGTSWAYFEDHFVINSLQDANFKFNTAKLEIIKSRIKPYLVHNVASFKIFFYSVFRHDKMFGHEGGFAGVAEKCRDIRRRTELGRIVEYRLGSSQNSREALIEDSIH